MVKGYRAECFSCSYFCSSFSKFEIICEYKVKANKKPSFLVYRVKQTWPGFILWLKAALTLPLAYFVGKDTQILELAEIYR